MARIWVRKDIFTSLTFDPSTPNALKLRADDTYTNITEAAYDLNTKTLKTEGKNKKVLFKFSTEHDARKRKRALRNKCKKHKISSIRNII